MFVTVMLGYFYTSIGSVVVKNKINTPITMENITSVAQQHKYVIILFRILAKL